jgi:translation elongation factor EF-G
LTGGRAAHTEDFDHYEEMPKELEAKVIAEAKKARDEQHHHA